MGPRPDAGFRGPPNGMVFQGLSSGRRVDKSGCMHVPLGMRLHPGCGDSPADAAATACNTYGGFLGGSPDTGWDARGVRSVEGRHFEPRESLRGALSRSSAMDGATPDRGPAEDRLAYVDALLQEMEESPPAPAHRRGAGHVLLGTGLLLVGIGFVGAAMAPTEEVLLSIVLGVNVLAVLCVATGILLLPGSRAPVPSGPAAARRGGWMRRGLTRIRGPVPRRPLRHAPP